MMDVVICTLGLVWKHLSSTRMWDTSFWKIEFYVKNYNENDHKKSLFPMSTPGSNWRHFNSMTNFDKTWLELRLRRSAKAMISNWHDQQWTWSAVSGPGVLPPGVRKLVFQHLCTLPGLDLTLIKFDQTKLKPWHRNIPSRSKVFERQWWLEKPEREVLDDTLGNHALPGRDAQ